MTKPELYRDDSRVRHMLDAMEYVFMGKAVAATLPPAPATPPPNMADFL